MKYYQVGLSADPKVIGVKNGIYQVEINKDELLKNTDFADFFNLFSTKNLNFWDDQNKIKELNIPKIYGELLKKAKVTDIMGYTPNIPYINNIFSERYLSILSNFEIDLLNKFEVNIDQVESIYYMAIIKTVLLEEVDFHKSIVITGYKVLDNIKYHSVKTRSEYRDFLQQNPLGGFEKLVIPAKYNSYDVIKTQASPLLFYSEKLIDFLLDCGITGLAVSYNNSIELDFY